MNKKGFTLVELMVVIVIIGVLAAVAIPKMMAATNKAKAGEGPQILRSIASMEAAYKASYDTYVNATAAERGTATGPWLGLGFDQNPYSRYFKFDVEGAAEYKSDGDYTPDEFVNTFTAIAEVIAPLGDADAGQQISVNQSDERTGGGNTALGRLLTNWRD